MYPLFFDDLATKMYPTTALHFYGVNGKVSGSVGAIGEISGDVIAVLHAPIGCGFHYRDSARRRHQPYMQLYCSDLTEEEVVYGGEEKLKKIVRQLYAKKSPKLIFIIPSPVADILNEDVKSTARDLREEGIPAVGIQSELFSHRDKNYAKNRLKELSKLKVGGDSILEIELKGCGFTEALYAIVDQVMKPQEVVPLSVNIETVGWGSEGYNVLREIEALFNKVGITVNTWIPSANYEKLMEAPKAQLNIVKRIRWARYMRDRFGTDYLFLNDTGRYVGIEGTARFFMDVAEKLGVADKMQIEIDKEMERAKLMTKDAREGLASMHCALISGFSDVPGMLKNYAHDLGIKIDTICVRLTDNTRITSGITPEVEENFMRRAQDAIDMYAPGAKIYVNPTMDEMRALFEKEDAIVGSSFPGFEGLGAAMISNANQIDGLSFDSYIRTVNRMWSRMKTKTERRELILNRMPFDIDNYPRMENRNVSSSRTMWERMWLDKSKEGCVE